MKSKEDCRAGSHELLGLDRWYLFCASCGTQVRRAPKAEVPA